MAPHRPRAAGRRAIRALIWPAAGGSHRPKPRPPPSAPRSARVGGGCRSTPGTTRPRPSVLGVAVPHRGAPSVPLPHHAHRGADRTRGALVDEGRAARRHSSLSRIPKLSGPSARRILEIFSDVQRHHLMSGEDVVRVFEPQPTSLQRNVLDHLHCPPPPTSRPPPPDRPHAQLTRADGEPIYD